MRVLSIVLVAISLAACSESPTDPAKPDSTDAGAASASAAANVVDKSDPGWKTSVAAPAELMAFDSAKDYLWILSTNKGTMRFRLFPDVAPMHVNSTIYLTELGFYDDVIFHRVIPGFMAQGGDPTGTGTGGPGYRYDGEFSAAVTHDRGGLLSMANAGPGTDGSQFFITFVPTPWLDGKHTIFGELVEGEAVLGTFETAGSRSGQVSEELKIIEATIDVVDVQENDAAGS